MVTTDDIRVATVETLPTPTDVKAKLPLSTELEDQITESRRAVERILDRKDPRKLVIVGPCAAYDPEATIEYAKKLALLADRVKDTMLILMRVYFEKPRTTTGWKGLINDPRLDDSFHVEEGLYVARKLLMDVAEIGLPIATEALDPIVPQYIGDLISWTAIGARTVESQTHREMASGLSSPVGFKNGTDGNVQIAINGITSAAQSHRFLGINQTGQASVISTRGNKYGHIVLRGGKSPNYDAASIASTEELMKRANVMPNIIVDCSHGNSNKDFKRQAAVFNEVLQQIEHGSRALVGWMIESNLKEGRQDLGKGTLQYGVSITDACISWELTESLLTDADSRLRK